jgi:hypothetical protein
MYNIFGAKKKRFTYEIFNVFSMDGLFLGNGPWRMNPDQTLRLVEGSWNEYANILYGNFNFLIFLIFIKSLYILYFLFLNNFIFFFMLDS